MRADPISPSPASFPALPADGANLYFPLWGEDRVLRAELEKLRRQAEQLGEVLRARHAWLEARRRELWQRIDRLNADREPLRPRHEAAPEDAPAASPDTMPPAALVPDAAAERPGPGRPANLASLAEEIEVLLQIVADWERDGEAEAAPPPPALFAPDGRAPAPLL